MSINAVTLGITPLAGGDKVRFGPPCNCSASIKINNTISTLNKLMYNVYDFNGPSDCFADVWLLLMCNNIKLTFEKYLKGGVEFEKNLYDNSMFYIGYMYVFNCDGSKRSKS